MIQGDEDGCFGRIRLAVAPQTRREWYVEGFEPLRATSELACRVVRKFVRELSHLASAHGRF